MNEIKITLKGRVSASFKKQTTIDKDLFDKLNANGRLSGYLENEAADLLDDDSTDLDPDLGDVELYSWEVVGNG